MLSVRLIQVRSVPRCWQGRLAVAALRHALGRILPLWEPGWLIWWVRSSGDTLTSRASCCMGFPISVTTKLQDACKRWLPQHPCPQWPRKPEGWRRIAQYPVPAADRPVFSPFRVCGKLRLVVVSSLRGQVGWIPSHRKMFSGICHPRLRLLTRPTSHHHGCWLTHHWVDRV